MHYGIKIKKNIRKRFLIFLSISLSFVSVHAGFSYYNALFGLLVAILASFTFETLRLTSLYGMLKITSGRRYFSLVLYLLSAFVCAFASIASFHSSVIEQYEISIEQMKVRQKMEISEIKRAQAKERDNQIEKMNKDITWCKIKLARNKESVYWKTRLEQIEHDKYRTEAKYDSILPYIPTGQIESWIERESFKYGIERIKESDKLGRAWTLASAIKDLWGISEITAKKLTGIVITIGVELGIIMLALLSHFQDFGKTQENGKIRMLYKKFDKRCVQNFVEKTMDFYAQNNKLPQASQLSRKSREIRKFVLDNLTNDELNELMGANERLAS